MLHPKPSTVPRPRTAAVGHGPRPRQLFPGDPERAMEGATQAFRTASSADVFARQREHRSEEGRDGAALSRGRPCVPSGCLRKGRGDRASLAPATRPGRSDRTLGSGEFQLVGQANLKYIPDRPSTLSACLP